MNPDVEVSMGQVPWPSSFYFGSIRLWGTDTTWADIEPSNPASTPPNWSGLDNWLSLAESHGVTNLVYTFGKGTPSWISSDPTDPTCTKPGSTNPTLGWCDPPSDVDSGDTSFKNFVTAIVQHVAGQIGAWECINEPDVSEEWTGTTAQTLTMCTDMYNIVKQLDPSALVLTPAPANGSSLEAETGNGKAVPWLTSYLQAGGGKYADVIAFHGYSRALPPTPIQTEPELVSNLAQSIVSAASSNGVGSYPVWDTEVGFNNDTDPGDITDPDQQAAYVAVVYLLQWSDGISRMYWYSYGNGATGTLTDGSILNEAGTAYGVVEQWMVGSTLTSPCSASGTVWTCAFKNAKGTQVLAVWDAGQSCTGGTCTTSNYSPSATYTQYVDLTGATHTISASNTAQIGVKPILLEP
ncbi:MAG: glycosyl hydrolase [Candidatus Sulfotelmatobacter sp.]